MRHVNVESQLYLLFILLNGLIQRIFVLFIPKLQTFRHGFPHSPTALSYDPIQKLLAIGDKSGSLRMYASFF